MNATALLLPTTALERESMEVQEVLKKLARDLCNESGHAPEETSLIQTLGEDQALNNELAVAGWLLAMFDSPEFNSPMEVEQQ